MREVRLDRSDRKAAKAKWARTVSDVFTRNPRDGSKRGVYWLARDRKEEKLCELLSIRGAHVCLDGSTGTGKTSLARTEMGFLGRSYAEVQITPGMDWKGFCRCLVAAKRGRALGGEVRAKAGLMPELEFALTIGPSSAGSEALEERERIATCWDVRDVCKHIVESKVILFIDDFELAPEELVRNVAAICKLLTQSFISEESKVLVVGTDDIFGRIMHQNPSLDARLEEITLGALEGPDESWQFIAMGFDQLKLLHPGNDHVEANRNQLDACRAAIYFACDGLPKSLTELGEKIALQGYARRRVSPSDIRSCAEEHARREFSRLQREIPRIRDLVLRSTEVRIVLVQMYKNGINRVHDASSLAYDLSSELSSAAVEETLDILAEAGFLVRTGPGAHTLFPSNPRLAHLLGAVVSSPQMFGRRPEDYAAMGQLRLPHITKAMLLPE